MAPRHTTLCVLVSFALPIALPAAFLIALPVAFPTANERQPD